MSADRPAATRRASARCAILLGDYLVRKDGTFGKHHLWHGHDYQGVCPGAFRLPEHVKAEDEWERTYDKAMQWRDWQTCEILSDEWAVSEWYVPEGVEASA
jgi:hypothetical protein